MELVCSNKFITLVVFVLHTLGVFVRKQEERMFVYWQFVLKHDFEYISTELPLQEHPLSPQESVMQFFWRIWAF